ncbi:flagellar biosynthesis protein FlhB [Helicobacter pullorum]|uniref:Flagellar biosynthetic protein FlhB n=1 Tax=Helicobacter pullorum TaxID=35818 RepID=A0A0N1MNH4_9HELI|nr:flagellar biosynthesis protein FlhB [Helicobacter pullorum]HIS09045.1 flagellar biosynthesis protein FlhB [Candidatus Scatomorpha intestinipullorum]KAB0575193.1 flagellar biosynthesis protein FlhB [Helicobacter pullorum NCTC 12824]KPH53185.1 flagellar biosynthesis protein FlhB [Helicobacter pullorum]KPH55587.1 flagellar biosynthesis protein FlhB [Helicobacter pullorum]OCR05162.1 flagellar biosynthesis protein FlhB [Helicobacter pullorum]
MADEEKTEAPSARKIEKAREEGNVLKSPDVNAFLGLVVGLVLIFLCFNFWVDGISNIFFQIYNSFNQDLTRSDAISITISLTFQILYLLAPIFGALVLTGIVANISQSGFLLTTKAIQPKLQKLNFITGIKNIISLKKLLDGFLITFKVMTAFIIAFFVFLGFMKELTTVSLFPIGDQMIWLKDKALILIAILLAFFLVMAITDYLIKRYQYFKSLRMSKQEVKDEFKNQEGDQQIKGKIRSLMFQAAKKRMMQNIPSADVVVTNPTHYAVALRYDSTKERAPRVLAKGVDFLAQRIKDIAKEHEIPIIENPPLARALYKDVDIDKEIPETLYQAMVEVLIKVQQINDERKKAS